MKDSIRPNKPKHYRLASGELFGESTLNPYVVTCYPEGDCYWTFIKTGIPYAYSSRFYNETAKEKIESGEWKEVKLVPKTGYDVIDID
jgi:hypothetical protein